VKLFSTDIEFLKKKAPEIEEQLKKIAGVVDTNDGLITAGPTLRFRVRPIDAQRFGLTASDVAAALNTAMLGQSIT
jgi:Cu/Ag efflux pump CusA